MRGSYLFLALTAGLAACNMSSDGQPEVTPAAVNFGADQANLAHGAQAAQACLEDMPDIKATKQALRAHGFSYREGTSSIELYATQDWGVTAQLQSGNVPNWICAVTVEAMTPGEAVALAQPWVKAIGGARISDSTKGVVDVWRGATADYDAVVVVYDKDWRPKIDGAMIKLELRNKN